MRDLEIHQYVMKTVDEYTGLTGSCQPRYEIYPYPQRLTHLSANLRMHVLREKGDYKKYLELQREVTGLCPEQVNSEDDALYKIIEWMDLEIDAISPQPDNNTLVISLLAFGKDYVRKMIDYNFATLLAPGNLPSLQKNVIIYLHTDAESHSIIEEATTTAALKLIGVKFKYLIIPDEIMSLVKRPEIVYWLLGASASLGVQYAKSLNAAFHHSYPDIIYNDKFFTELHRLASAGNKAILGSGMRSDETMLIPSLQPYTTPDHIAIPCGDLLALHLNSIHMCAWGMVMNNRPQFWSFPQSHILIWESEEIAHFNSPHVMAHWLEPEVIRDLPTRYYMTLDSEMDMICKSQNFYMIGEEDEIYQIELSAPDRQFKEDNYCDVYGTADILWGCVSHRDTMKFFFREMRLKINRDIRPKPINVMQKSQVEVLQIYLYNTILSRDPYANVQLARGRTHNGYLFR